MCEILPAAYALTGCDTTSSSFFGIGKKSMLKALKETPNQFSDLSRIECSDIDDSVDLSRKLISEGKVETMPYRFEQIAGKIGNCQRFYFGDIYSDRE